MISLFSGLGLFFFLFFFLVLYYSFYWKLSDISLSGCLRSWLSSFECGFVSQGLVTSSFSFTYMVLLVFFVLFDLEVSLLLKLPFQGIMYDNYMYYLFFIISLTVGYMFELYKGYIHWGY